MKFSVTNDQGLIIECNILFTFKDEANNIDYIIYTDGTKNELGEDEIYSSRYVVEEGNYILKDIETEYEWNLIDNFLASKFNEVDD